MARVNPEKADLLIQYAIGKVVDIGCGSGVYTNSLHKNGHEIIGVDFQEEFVKSAKKTYPEISFVQGSAEKLPFKKGTFDTAILFDILEHLDDKKVINEALRVAKRLIISVPRENQDVLLRYGLSHAHYLDRTHKRTYIEESLRKLMEEQSLKILYLEPALPLSLSGILIERLSLGSSLRRLILKIILKPFLPEPPLYSTIFAVVDRL